ncbi:MAG: BamA/TamA family outer membrane protein [Bacteroidales bacterium]|nr:BamA/TamA family outer membrane protein [Bacteroidales bacterium]MDD3988501.1 BamA/TamA family outer membrane protein [Bacteroidales bacterium]
MGKISPLLIISLVLISCSTVRIIPQGSSRLKENIISVPKNFDVEENSLQPYIRQKPNTKFLFGINPFLVIYNWSNGKDDDWDKFVKSIGQPPVIYDSILTSRSRENLEKHLEYLGYYHSRVRYESKTSGKKTSVKYIIQPGQRYVISKIEYGIPDRQISEYVLADSSNRLFKTGDFLSESLLAKESERISSLLREEGYYNFSSGYIVFDADTSFADSSAHVRIRVQNYMRSENSKDSRSHRKYVINSVNILPDNSSSRGRRNVENPPDSVTIDSLTVIYSRGRNFNPAVLARINRIRPGSIYNEKLVNTTYNRFVSLRFFSGVNLQFDDVTPPEEMYDTGKPGKVDCTIRLTPSRSQGYKINLEVSSNSNNLFGISPAISYYHKNIFKGGEWLNLGLMGNFQSKLNSSVKSNELGISAGISIPQFLFLPDRLFSNTLPRTEVNTSYNFQSRPEFTRNLISFNFGYTWQMGERFYYRFNPVQLNVIKLFNLSDQFFLSLSDPLLRNAYRNHFDVGSGLTLYYTTDPSPNPMNSFFYIRMSNDLAGNILSLFNSVMPTDSTGSRTIWRTAYAQYYRGDLTVGYTHRISTRSSFATRFNLGVGYAYGNSSAIPYEKLFYSGGANSMRGWQARSLGPGSAPVDTTFSIANQTGDVKIEFNAEYRFPLFWKLEGALFTDVGNIWNLNNEPGKEAALFKIRDFYKTLAFNWGTGVRLNFDFLILRLDLGMVAYDPRADRWYGLNKWFTKDTYSLQFGVGYPF